MHWICVDLQRANELIDNIVSGRDSAIHRSQVPDLAAAPGVNAHVHAEKVSEFYGEHAWLGEGVSMSLAAELAFYWMLANPGLLDALFSR